MAMAVMQITTAANIENVDPVTNAGFSISQIDAMNKPANAVPRKVTVRPFRVVIIKAYPGRNEFGSPSSDFAPTETETRLEKEGGLCQHFDELGGWCRPKSSGKSLDHSTFARVHFWHGHPAEIA